MGFPPSVLRRPFFPFTFDLSALSLCLWAHIFDLQ